MKTRLAHTAPLLLLLSSAAIATAQVPTGITPPPIKMGLWQSTITVGTTGGMGPMGRGSNSTHQSCYTPDSWKDAMAKAQARQPNMNCTTSNFEQTPSHISFDGACSMDQGMNANYHVEMILDSDTAMHGNTTTKISGPMFPNGMSVNSNISAKFISSDCGDVKPGESKSVHP